MQLTLKTQSAWVKSTFIIIPLLAVLLGFELCRLAFVSKNYVESTYKVPESQDELLHQLISKKLALNIYDWTGNLTLSKNLTLMIGYTKELVDWLEGEDVEERDLKADWQGCLEAEQEIKARTHQPSLKQSES